MPLRPPEPKGNSVPMCGRRSQVTPYGRDWQKWGHRQEALREEQGGGERERKRLEWRTYRKILRWTAFVLEKLKANY